MASRYGSYSWYMDYLSVPLPLCFFVFVLFLFLGLSWYASYESMLEDFFNQLRLILIVSPLLLLLIVHWLSSGDDHQRVPFIIPLPERDSLHRAGGSPWGVACLLVFLLFMISYHSTFQELWFPFSSR